MLRDKLKKLAKDPKFISGVYNYCDRWCERCPFTSRCMNYALGEEDDKNDKSNDIKNKEFWDKLHEIFSETLEMVREDAKERGIDLEDIDDKEFAKQEELIHNKAQEQPYSRSALEYTDMVSRWFESNKELLKEKSNELMSLVEAEISGVRPDEEAFNIADSIDVISWYQHQIYVKLCRAATGLMRDEFEGAEYFIEDANGSAKVAIIGIERSIAAWGGLLKCFAQQEDSLLNILAHLQGLLRLVELHFPQARSFVRPGFDTEPNTA